MISEWVGFCLGFGIMIVFVVSIMIIKHKQQDREFYRKHGLSYEKQKKSFKTNQCAFPKRMLCFNPISFKRVRANASWRKLD